MLRVLILGALCCGSFGFVSRPPMPDNRIVGGVETTIAAHPHQVSVQLYGRHYCGGSIISHSWVVTAGRCARGSSAASYKISAGSADKLGGIIYTVNRVVIHPNFDAWTIDYDVAILQINGTFKFNSSIQAIKLATVEIPANRTVNVTGWGITAEGAPSARNLMQVTVPIIDRKYCSTAYASINAITPRMICAGVEKGGKDSCHGDSGGPLSMNGTLYGIVSWGHGCARPKYPGVYTNVPSVRSWINATTGV